MPGAAACRASICTRKGAPWSRAALPASSSAWAASSWDTAAASLPLEPAKCTPDQSTANTTPSEPGEVNSQGALRESHWIARGTKYRGCKRHRLAPLYASVLLHGVWGFAKQRAEGIQGSLQTVQPRIPKQSTCLFSA